MLDLTCDIRKLIVDLTGGDKFLPANRSQANKWKKSVRDRGSDWIVASVQPVTQTALDQGKMAAKLEIAGAERDKLLVHYPAIKQGTGYVAPTVTLEFGGRCDG